MSSTEVNVHSEQSTLPAELNSKVTNELLPLQKQNENEENEIDAEEIKPNSEIISNLLTSAYGVIKLILEQLQWQDLMQAAEVCSEWKKVADVIFSERHEAFWFYFKRRTRYTLEFLPLYQYSKPALCIVFVNEAISIPIKCKYLHDELIRSRCNKYHRLLQYVKVYFEKSGCDIVGVCSNSVKASFIEPVIRMHVYSQAELIGISIPEIPHVKMRKFHIKKDSDFNDLVQTHIGEDHHLKCLLTFIGLKKNLVEQTMIVEKFLRAIYQHQPSVPFAFGGGIIRGTKESEFDTSFRANEGNIICITFSTPKNEISDFNAASVILWENAVEKEDIDIIFGHLLRKTVKREHMAAFRFACISRYNLSDAEFDSFAKYFPGVRMIGFEGLGEVGLYSVPDDTETQESKRPCTDREFAHSNTSIIVLLSWGRKLVSNKISSGDEERKCKKS